MGVLVGSPAIWFGTSVTLAAGLLGETVISHPGLLKAMQCGISISNDRRAGVANRTLAVFNVSLHLGRQASHGFGVPFSLLIPFWKRFRWLGKKYLKHSDPM